MVADMIGKRVLVLSDNDGLSRAIELNLRRNLPVEVSTLQPGSLKKRKHQDGRTSADLIVVAMSSPASEPVVALSRAALTGHIGEVPLLIISDRAFRTAPEDRIAHLDFPFDLDGLCDKVREILSARV